MKEQQRLEKVLNEAFKVAQQEVSSLTGANLVLEEPQFSIQSKEDAFDSLSSKQVCAKIDVVGDVEGEGCLLVSIRDAIRLGGILIMLPESELSDFAASENFSEEIEDSYGEIANITAGAYSKAFEDLYPKSCRLIRKEQEVIAPAKVDIESDEPVVNQLYFVARHAMSINDASEGDMILMLPAETFGLVEASADETQPEAVDAEQQQAETAASDTAAEAAEEISPVETEEETAQEVEAVTVEEAPAEETANCLPYNPKNIDRLDKVIEGSQQLLADEVGGLIGAELAFAGHSCEFMKKEDLLEYLNGQQVAASMDVRGDFEGEGALFVELKAAIRLGGTLIMLPQTELEEVVGRNEYSEETEDSYGEIANIIAGSYSKVFEDLFPKNCRLIRKEQKVITPVKLSVEDDKPLPDQLYYVVKNPMTLDGTDCGELVLALPGLSFGIVSPDEQPAAKVQDEKSNGVITGKASSEEKDGAPAEAAAADAAVSSQPTAKAADSEKQKTKVDKLLSICEERMQEEVSAMLGTEVRFAPAPNRIIEKEEFFFDQVSGKQVLANVDVSGEIEEKSYLYIGIKDAIRIGGILIMLPPNELEQVIADDEYSDDINDAYGEIANIIAGVYSGVFEEQFSKKLRFVRKELDIVAPMTVEVSSEEPMPDRKYYLHCLQVNINGQDLGELSMVIPADVLQLEHLGAVEKVQQGETAATKPGQNGQTAPQKKAGVTGVTTDSADSAGGAPAATAKTTGPAYDIIVIGNNSFEIKKISAVLQGKGLVVRELTFKDNVNNYINSNIKAVFLVMQEVNELGFGIAIKISSSCSKPLIAAGSDWTRTKVIKAVKYGVRDILLTPSSDQDIIEKLENNLVQLAA